MGNTPNLFMVEDKKRFKFFLVVKSLRTFNIAQLQRLKDDVNLGSHGGNGLRNTSDRESAETRSQDSRM